MGLVMQAIIQQGVFKSSSAAGHYGCLVHPTTDDDFFICRNTRFGQVLVLPSQSLVRPTADDDFVICQKLQRANFIR